MKPMNARNVFGRRTLYLGWTAVSAITLALAGWFNPYLFGFAAIGSFWVTCGLVVGCLVFARRHVGWALLSLAPALVSLGVLSTYRWA